MDVVNAVKKAKKGDKEALLQLILAEKEAYYRLAFSYMRNEADAMDVLEEMIVRLYERIGQLKKEESFYTWSKTILVNQCKRSLKRNNKVIPLGDPDVNKGHISSIGISDYRQVEEQMDLQALLTHLNADQREAIQLKYYHDLDYGSIAAMTRVSTGTVKSRIYQGLQKLRALYGRNTDEQH
ncbi:sigma-70 family RNA polymerase sigma factor [Paenibacillus sp. FSL H7-0331]|uniref:sigma-70 family RNA polymerase sigma factor n=1 Tax=Paenibacillus sp. FSL H7-0331 TaxID=1920421 RepID=UPI00096DFB6B|nr:sigma-70 family RNA polymerase sigma factor [Paenibacillus sp. FSL H7-0331]OMF06071.1 RNA polymerase subunit sigma-24 [Paenibacillus sp. FSL H7-0331]